MKTLKKEIIKILESYSENGVFPDENETRLIYEQDFEKLAEEITEYIQKLLSN